MADCTPSRRAVQLTPGTGKRTSVARTPQSTLTPNDDAAERASTRRKRQSEVLRMSLADTFAGQADQHRQHGGGSGHAGSNPTLSPEALAAMFEQCIRLAAENKINDLNVWQLNLISHLPDIVVSGSGVSTSTSGFNFQKMSGGLDAGVTIYSKRVDLTYKEAFMSLSGGPSRKGDDGDDNGAGDEGCPDDGDGVEDAAAAAAAKAKGGGKRARHQGGDEESTLAAPEALRQKKLDTTFAVDPLFHTMSALFDEGGAKGLLLMNRSVFASAHIMTAPHEVPEQAFPLEAAPQPDELLDLAPLRQQLAACASGAGRAASAGAVLTPGLDQLYALLEQSSGKAAQAAQREQQREQQAAGVLDVAAIMRQATRGLPPTPMPGKAISSSSSSRPAAAAGSSSAWDGSSAMDADAAAGPDSEAAGGCAGGPSQAGAPVVAGFLASCDATDAAEAAAAEHGSGAFGLGCDGGPDDDAADGDAGFADHEGYEADDDCGPLPQQQEQQQSRRQSMLGLAGGAQGDTDGSDVLDADALQQLLAGSSGGPTGSGKGSTTQGAGWAGSRFWKYRSAAAAAARMAVGSGSTAAPVKRAAAAAGAAGGRSKAAAFRIDFNAPPADLQEALAQGSRRQTCLLSATSSAPAATLLPEDLHYQAANLAQLFLRPCPISALRQQHQYAAAAGAAGGADAAFQAAAGSGWAGDDEGSADGGGWGGEGYEDHGDGGGWGGEGYNAGDLSVGDPGFAGGSGGNGGRGGGNGADWWGAEGGELLSAPARATGLGVTYQRAAKQVDVRALKDIVWGGLLSSSALAAAASGADGGPASSGGDAAPMVPFERVIEHVPEHSAAGRLDDVSVHMCFICLLHLANERGLVLRGEEDLRTLTIGNVAADGGGGAPQE